MRNKLLLILKRQDFLIFFCFWKTAKYCLGPELEPEPEHELEPKFF
jgi:hypothetical protein